MQNPCLLIGGDDSIVAYNGVIDLSLYQSTMSELGFSLDAKHKNLTNVSFFSSYFVPTSQGFVLTPMLGKYLVKFPYRLGGTGSDKAWLKGVTKASIAIFGHVPFMEVYFKHIYGLLVDFKILPDSDTIVICRRQTTRATVVPETYQWLFDLYGITKHDIASFLSYVPDIRLNSTLDHPLVSKLLETEEIHL